MRDLVKNLKLQMNVRLTWFLTPLFIMSAVALVSAIISIAAIRGGVDVSSPEYMEGARMNMAMLWSVPGFLVYLGVATVATTFPYALALGTTRRAFALGAFASHVLMSAYIAGIMLVILALELLTNHWFISIYLVDIYMLGSGNPFWLAIIVFLVCLTSMSAGAFFGATWTRFGNRGPTVLGIAAGLIIALLVLILAPYFGEIFANFQTWWLAVLAGVLIVGSVVGEYLCLRNASVR